MQTLHVCRNLVTPEISACTSGWGQSSLVPPGNQVCKMRGSVTSSSATDSVQVARGLKMFLLFRVSPALPPQYQTGQIVTGLENNTHILGQHLRLLSNT